MSDLELKFLQHVTFWIYFFHTWQILFWKKYNASNFNIDTFRHLVFQRQLHLKVTFCSVNPWKRHFFQFSCFLERMFWNWRFITCQILNWKNTACRILKKKNKASGFDFKTSQQVRCCNEKKSNASDFDIDTFRHLVSHRQLH